MGTLQVPFYGMESSVDLFEVDSVCSTLVSSADCSVATLSLVGNFEIIYKC